MSRSLPHLTLTTSTVSLSPISSTSLIFPTVSPSQTNPMILNPYVPAMFHGRVTDQHKSHLSQNSPRAPARRIFQRLLDTLVQRLLPRIFVFGYVTGHCGHPWNELADTLCDHVSRGDFPLVCDWDQLVLRHRPPLRLDSSPLRWALVLHNSYQSEAYPPPVWSDGAVPFSLPHHLV